MLVITIIGVVASLTIPDLIINIQTQQYKTAWKKNFSIFSQATNQLLEDEGKGNFIDIFTSGTVMQEKYEQYFKVIKSYPAWGGWHSNNTWYYLNSDPLNDTKPCVTYLLDGTMISFADIWSACNGIRGNMTDLCAQVFFDTNGFKKPNTIGKDIFTVYVRSNKITPRGSSEDDGWVQTSCTSTGQGWGCANKYLLE